MFDCKNCGYCVLVKETHPYAGCYFDAVRPVIIKLGELRECSRFEERKGNYGKNQ